MTDDRDAVPDDRDAVYSVIEHAITQQPRTLQRAIGPSELAMDCEHCLAAKLAGWEKMPEAAWLPFLGTALHAALEEIFEPLDGWLTETRVSVGTVRGQEVLGTSDLFRVETGCVIDHKLVGATTLTSAKRGPTAQYRGQAHLYGLGFFRAGYDVKKVAINYLPRNAVSLRAGVWWEEPFDPLAALAALDRVEELGRLLDDLAAVSIESRDSYIRGLPRSGKCFDCRKYPDAPRKAPASSLDDLLGVAG
ncbi:hypothetical protein [Microbacterium sp. No. 7]|uniref:hypothetical protein n=1 Tax=Microbacterium sp. No. 7 TaxID=1714373 RepID=UPI0006ED1853|nr:hypothetical protein [Microbacterium sp. No. 7]ALJ19564.1 hypothetical protein AOA12_06425 [Microbacterium sp. No. 7]